MRARDYATIWNARNPCGCGVHFLWRTDYAPAFSACRRCRGGSFASAILANDAGWLGHVGIGLAIRGTLALVVIAGVAAALGAIGILQDRARDGSRSSAGAARRSTRSPAAMTCSRSLPLLLACRLQLPPR
jgi:hypothetical protein